MTERAKIVVEDYPVSRLPDELRRGLDRDGVAKITIEAEAALQPRSLRSFIGSGRGVYSSPAEAVGFVRRLRDEWE